MNLLRYRRLVLVGVAVVASLPATASWAQTSTARTIDCSPGERQRSGTEQQISCMVADASGNPVADEEVLARERGVGTFDDGQSSQTKTTDENGVVSFTVVTESNEVGGQTVRARIAESREDEPDLDECERDADDPPGAPEGRCFDEADIGWSLPPGCRTDGRRTSDEISGEVIIGTPDAERITGTEGEDIICARGGNDILQGLGGHDQIFGNAGADTIDGGDGRDRLTGDKGRDQLSGGNGVDIVRGGNLPDLVRGNRGNDEVYGGRNSDVLRGGKHNDIAFGGNSDDQLFGWTGDDVLRGEDGDDTIRAGRGDDALLGGHGYDVCYGESGQDHFRRCQRKIQ